MITSIYRRLEVRHKIKHEHELVRPIMNVLRYPLIRSLSWQEEPLDDRLTFHQQESPYMEQLRAQTTPSPFFLFTK